MTSPPAPGTSHPPDPDAAGASDQLPPPVLAAVIAVGTRACRSCAQMLPETAVYCSGCGAAQIPALAAARQRRRRHAQAGAEDAHWPLVRQVILLYVVILATIIPLYWLPAQQLAAGMMVVSALHAGIVAVVALRWRSALVGLFAWNPGVARWGLIGLGLVALLLGIDLGYHGLLHRLLGIHMSSLSDPFTRAGYGRGVQLLIIALMPGIVEEIIFRGLIQTRLRQVLGAQEAILVSAILFATIHRAIFSWPYLFLFGLVLAQVRERSRSLLPGMLMHAVHNAVVLTLEA